MANGLKAFLIDVAKDEEKLTRFLKDPRKEAVNARLSPDEVGLLMTRDGHKIFEAMGKAHEANWIWICVTATKRPARPVKKTPARNHR